MILYDFLKENNDKVLFVDRTGNLIRVYCSDDVSVLFRFPNVLQAQKKYRLFRKELEGIKV